MPLAWRQAAQLSSADGQPLDRVVRELIQMANNKQFTLFGHEFHINRAGARYNR
jgi:hypothetical protein